MFTGIEKANIHKSPVNRGIPSVTAPLPHINARRKGH